MTALAHRFDNTYATLPPRFYEKLAPSQVQAPELIKLNASVASLLDLDANWLQSETGVAMLAGNYVPDGAEPLAMAYSGHQFGGWAPQLGDGRAILLGELQGTDGHKYDLQLKGAGRTPFSRGGDGRAWIGPVMREYIVGESMAALGIPTTRALAAVTTGEQVIREQGFVPGAVLTRVARSHVRVGTFEFFAARRDNEGLKVLADYVIGRFYPECAEQAEPYVSLLERVLYKQAKLVALWQWVGFIHGVMNTDNMNVSGETIDYGPCAFMDNYEAGKTFSSIDRGGRYAYSNQPRAAQWNLAVLAQCLLPLIQTDESGEEAAIEKAQSVVDSFPPIYQKEFVNGMRRKLGLANEQDDDLLLGSELLELMESGKADFTLTFFRLYQIAVSLQAGTTDNASVSCPSPSNDTLTNWLQLFENREEASQWIDRWLPRLIESSDSANSARGSTDNTGSPDWLETMRLSNPAIIPRNHQIENAISEAVNNKSYTAFEELLTGCTHPFDTSNTSNNTSSQTNSQPEATRSSLMTPPESHEEVTMTFCGT